jgi:pyruvate carboxylase
VPISKILVANRSEIAIRVFRAANELGMKTVAIWAEEDKLSLHRFKADESYQVGRGPHLERDLGPIESYLSIDEVIRVAKLSGADAIHPGYGLLSESPEFADACAENGIIFIGPRPETMRRLGNKVAARNLAIEIGVPVVPATEPLPDDMDEVARMADEIGYPVMLKASWGGGGRGMRAIRARRTLREKSPKPNARRWRRSARMKSISKSWSSVPAMSRARFSATPMAMPCICSSATARCSAATRRWSSARRRPTSTTPSGRNWPAYALKIAKATGYVGAGTVEFLMDADTGAFYFIEVNPRIQVEHTVTEEVTGIDIVKAQIHVARRPAIGTPESGVPVQDDIRLNGHACSAGSPPRSRAELHSRLRPHHRLSRRHRLSASGSTAALPIPAR